MVFDKAYVDFDHLADLDTRGVWWVTRAKDNMKYHAIKNLPADHDHIIKDQIVALKGRKGMRVRRVEAWVEVDGKWHVMVFITNNLTWSARSVCDLSRRRWDIEVFFKQVKQSLKLGSFLGHSANAVRWQVYSALMVYVAALPSIHVELGSQLHAAFRGDPFSPVGADRPARFAEILWDSIRTNEGDRSAQ